MAKITAFWAVEGDPAACPAVLTVTYCHRPRMAAEDVFLPGWRVVAGRSVADVDYDAGGGGAAFGGGGQGRQIRERGLADAARAQPAADEQPVDGPGGLGEFGGAGAGDDEAANRAGLPVQRAHRQR